MIHDLHLHDPRGGRKRRERRARSPGRSGGFALVGVLVIGLPLLIITGAAIGLVVANHQELEQRVGRDAARTVANSGAHFALAALDEDFNFEGNLEVALTGGEARIEIADWETDGIDNDGDADVDGPSERLIVGVVSDAWVNAELDVDGNPIPRPVRSYHSTTEVLLRRSVYDLEIEQAVYIDDPLATIDIAGNAFLLSGDDTNRDGSAGEDASTPGIGVPGDPTNIADQILAAQEDNIIGEGGTPSIQTVEPLDLAAIVDDLIAMATIRWEDPVTSLSGASIGDPDDISNMEIAYAVGDLRLSGGTTGSGILIVGGDLEVTGTLDYSGIIIAMGSVTLRGGGSKEIYGGLACLGALEALEIEIAGNVNIYYNSFVLREVAKYATASLEVVSWSQKG